MTTDDVLLWMTTAGGATAVVSFLLSFWSKFSDLSERNQFIVRTSIMIAIAIVAQVGLQYIPEGVKNSISPYVNTIGILLGGTFIAHQSGKSGQNTVMTRGLRRDDEKFTQKDRECP